MINTGVLLLKDQKIFDIGEFLVRPINQIYCIIKKAAAIVHRKQILPQTSKAIIKASNEVISGKLNFTSLKVWQTGWALKQIECK